MENVKLQVSLPAATVELLREQAVQKGVTIGEVLRQNLANTKFIADIVNSEDKELLVENKQTHSLERVKFAG